MTQTYKPDLDNLLKAVFDALTNLGVWQDDSQIATINAQKYYCDTPGALISITQLSE